MSAITWCYKDVTDTSAVAQFKLIRAPASAFSFANTPPDVYVLAWTTTPWTLPSNTSLVVGEKIRYVIVDTFNPYTFKPVCVILAKDLLGKYFSERNKELSMDAYNAGDKAIPFKVLKELSGKELTGLRYEQLMPYVKPHTMPKKLFKL